MNDKLPKQIFIFSAIACIGLRIFLKLTAVDPVSGFYEGNRLVVVLFTALLAIGVLLLILQGLRKRACGISVVCTMPLKLLAMLSGIFAVVGGVKGLYHSIIEFSNFRMSLSFLTLFMNGIGVASGVLLLHIGIKNRVGQPLAEYNGALLLLPLFWQVPVLLSTFMSYTAIRSVSDQLLTVVMLVLLIPFLLAHGRVLGNIDPRKGVRHLYAFGLPFSLLALTTASGIIAAFVVGKALSIGPDLLGMLSYLLLGLYAAALVFSVKPSQEIDRKEKDQPRSNNT